MNTPIASRNPKKQRGAATLVIAMILLFGVTLVVLFTAGSTYTEIRMSANEVRTREAFAEAQGALDFGIMVMQAGGVPDPDDEDPPININISQNGTIAPEGGKSRLIFLASDAIPNACPDTPGDLGGSAVAPPGASIALIFACGWSDDDVARQHVAQITKRRPAMAESPDDPITALGGVGLGGSMTVVNYYGNSTIRTGRDATHQGSGITLITWDDSGENFINRPMGDDPVPGCTLGDGLYNNQCKNQPTAPSGSAVVENSAEDVSVYFEEIGEGSLSSITPSDLFKNYFGSLPSEYYTEHVTLAVNNVDDLPPDVKGEVIWVDGSADFNGNLTIGTRDAPVILIIDGNLSGSGTVEVYGIVYVGNFDPNGNQGNFTANGNFTVYGAAIIDGAVTGSGSLDVIYDPVAVGGARDSGHSGTIAGTWRDWL